MSAGKLLMFGAGKIGRSFIAQIFSRGKYEVVFVDVNREIIRQINRKGSYQLIFRGEKGEEKVVVKPVRGFLFEEYSHIVKELEEARYVAISVGKKAFPIVMEALGKMIPVVWETYPEKMIDIILAENIRYVSRQAAEILIRNGMDEKKVKEYVGLIETSIGKMVPLAAGEDHTLDVVAEPYNELILDGEAFKNEIPRIKDITPKKNMQAWVDRKLFIHNLGHAAVAYFSSYCEPGKKYIWEALERDRIREKVFEAMREAAEVLLHLYPGVFTREEIINHIHDLLVRFANKALGDTVYRVGCDLPRKLGRDDRIVPVIRYACDNGLPYEGTLKTLLAGIRFNTKNEKGKELPADRIFFLKYRREIKKILLEHCGFHPVKHKKLIEKALKYDKKIICS